MMRRSSMAFAWQMAASLDALLYSIRLQFGLEMEAELVWDEFANEVYRRGGGDVGDCPEWMLCVAGGVA